MSRFRKFFNILSKEQQKLIDDGCSVLKALATKKASSCIEHDREREKINNSTCPLCNSNKIVNKISNVEGKGNVSGSLYCGSGSIYGSSKINTSEVNHCSTCGNQWKKYSRKYISSDDILAGWFNDINAVYEGIYSYGDKTVELLKDIPAESLLVEFENVENDCYYSTQNNITLKFLKTKFKSVWDK
jgi:hypothetical protein